MRLGKLFRNHMWTTGVASDFFFSSRRRHTGWTGDWSSDVCSSDLSGETRRDYVVELGRGAVVDEIEAAVVGMNAGETKEISFELGPEGGESQSVTLTVKEIKERNLPDVDDELARSASEFETLAELRSDIESRLLEQISEETEAQFRS